MGITYAYSPFRKEYHEMVRSGAITECPFCSQKNIETQSVRDINGKPAQNASARWLINYYPYCDGHTLVTPKRHVTSLHDLTREEVICYHDMIRFAADTLRKLKSDAGIEIFLQYGKGSRVSIPHLHTHVVLALPGDNFRGMQKLGYFEAFEKDEKKVIMLPIEVTLAREELIEALASTVDLDELAKYSASN